MTAVPIPALTVRQPWASLIVEGVKRVETRTRPCPAKYIGQRVAIHAGASTAALQQQLTLGPFVAYRQADAWRLLDQRPERGQWTDRWVELPLGAIVGSARIIGSYPMIETGAPMPNAAFVHARSFAGTRYEWTFGRLVRDRYGSTVGREIDYELTDLVRAELPYGDWRPSRWAWLLDDARSCRARCPFGCAPVGDTRDDRFEDGSLIHRVPDGPGAQVPGGRLVSYSTCPACDGRGTCAPIPARGRLGFWPWLPNVLDAERVGNES